MKNETLLLRQEISCCDHGGCSLRRDLPRGKEKMLQIALTCAFNSAAWFWSERTTTVGPRAFSAVIHGALAQQGSIVQLALGRDEHWCEIQSSH